MKIAMTISKIEPSTDGVYVGGSVNALLSLINRIRPQDADIELITCMPESKASLFKQNKPAKIHYSILSNNAKPQSLHFGLISITRL